MIDLFKLTIDRSHLYATRNCSFIISILFVNKSWKFVLFKGKKIFFDHQNQLKIHGNT